MVLVILTQNQVCLNLTCPSHCFDHVILLDWQLFTASIMTDTSVRDMFISAVTNFASSGMSSQPLTDWYDAVSGQPETFRARPVVGGHRK